MEHKTIIKLTDEERQWLNNIMLSILQNSDRDTQTYEDWNCCWKIFQSTKS